MIGCLPVEIWWWQGQGVGMGQEDLERICDEIACFCRLYEFMDRRT